jgi:hypothetical protein
MSVEDSNNSTMATAEAVADHSQQSSMHNMDVEKAGGDYAHLTNTSVRDFTWDNVTVTVKDRVSGGAKVILDECRGIVKAGEMMAIMGPRSASTPCIKAIY